MRAADLRHRIKIEQQTSVPDGIGGQTVTWIVLAETWAAVWPAIGKEGESGMMQQGEVSHKVRVRYLSGVLPSMRAIHGGRTLEILDVLNWQERGIYLDLLCRELV